APDRRDLRREVLRGTVGERRTVGLRVARVEARPPAREDGDHLRLRRGRCRAPPRGGPALGGVVTADPLAARGEADTFDRALALLVGVEVVNGRADEVREVAFEGVDDGRAGSRNGDVDPLLRERLLDLLRRGSVDGEGDDAAADAAGVMDRHALDLAEEHA